MSCVLAAPAAAAAAAVAAAAVALACVHPSVVLLEADSSYVTLVTFIVECLLWAVAVDVKQLDVAVACCCYKTLVACYFQFVDLQLGREGVSGGVTE